MDKIVETGMKLDLHIHSYKSVSKDGKKVKNNTKENLHILIKGLNDNGVNICAITDHDSFDYELYSMLKQCETDDSSIKKVLPGIEFSVLFTNRDNVEKVIHVVTIFSDIDNSKVQGIADVLEQNPYDRNGAYSEELFLKILRDINIDTILIAHQKNTLTSKSPKKDDANSLGEGKFLEFVYSDFFEAFEFKNRRNEVINKNYLIANELEERIRFVTGSDCHEWSVYPKEDLHDQHTVDFPYTFAKCLPTFKGLVMAMTDHSRLKRTNSFYCVDKTILESIELEQNGNKITVPLSKGINVIIGDNSVGKSMILHALCKYEKEGTPLPQKVKTGYKEYSKKLGLKIKKQLSKDDVFCFDMQGEIGDKFELGSFDASGFLSKRFPEDIDTSSYRNILINEVDLMVHYLEQKFKIDGLLKKLNPFTIHIREGAPESIVFEKNLRALKKKTGVLDEIITEFDKVEFSLNKLLGLKIDDEDKTIIRSQIDTIKLLIDKYKLRIDSIEKNNQRIEIIAKVIDNAAKQHNKTISDNQKRETQFSECTNSLKECLVELLSLKKDLNIYKPTIPPMDIAPKSNAVHNYAFISKTSISRIDEDYIFDSIKSVLKQGKNINWETITENKLKDLLLRYDEKTPVLQFFKTVLTEKFDEDLKPKRAINHDGMDKYDELSSGMNSKIYFDLLSYETNNDGIYIIDQPEDNVSQQAIKHQLLECFKCMGETRQVIMVTHNPQFIVNLDVDNIIYISKNNNLLTVQSGALEYECESYKILDIVANNIDGGLDSIQKRWKRYEKIANI